MRIVVTGGRDYQQRELVFAVLDDIREKRGIEMLAHGGATGADSLADEWAQKHGITTAIYHADWNLHGKSAGPIRNRKMLASFKPDAVVAFPGGAGTADCMTKAEDMGIPVYFGFEEAL